MREERRAVLARHNGDFRSVTPGRLSDFSKARCVEAGDSYALVYRATYYARNEGGRGLERMREVHVSFAKSWTRLHLGIFRSNVR